MATQQHAEVAKLLPVPADAGEEAQLHRDFSGQAIGTAEDHLGRSYGIGGSDDHKRLPEARI